MRKVVLWDKISNQWFVWDKTLRAIRAYFPPTIKGKREADNFAAQLELF